MNCKREDWYKRGSLWAAGLGGQGFARENWSSRGQEAEEKKGFPPTLLYKMHYLCVQKEKNDRRVSHRTIKWFMGQKDKWTLRNRFPTWSFCKLSAWGEVHYSSCRQWQTLYRWPSNASSIKMLFSACRHYGEEYNAPVTIKRDVQSLVHVPWDTLYLAYISYGYLWKYARVIELACHVTVFWLRA